MSAHEAPAGTLRAACETLTADIAAAVEKMRATLASAHGEQTTVEELLAVTEAQVRLVKVARHLERLAGGMLTETAELREREGIPITEREILGGCGCPGCTAQQEGKARTHTMPARAFIAPSAHVPADAAAAPPPLPPLHRERLHALLDEIEASVKEARGLLSGAA